MSLNVRTLRSKVWRLISKHPKLAPRRAATTPATCSLLEQFLKWPEQNYKVHSPYTLHIKTFHVTSSHQRPATTKLIYWASSLCKKIYHSLRTDFLVCTKSTPGLDCSGTLNCDSALLLSFCSNVAHGSVSQRNLVYSTWTGTDRGKAIHTLSVKILSETDWCKLVPWKLFAVFCSILILV